MNAKPTPGPWKVDDDGFTVRDSNDDFVADARCFAYTDSGEEDLPTNGPNARLIAAAPDLLEALATLHLHTVVGTDDQRHAALNQAWAAIAKATGEA